MTTTRRDLLAPLAAIPVLTFEALPVLAQGTRLELTPQCSAGAEKTAPSTEGPYFQPNSPQRHDLAIEIGRGDGIILGGFVLDETCQPIQGALVELWHADNIGRYDNRGYMLRGHHLTDTRGMWWFSTIVPASYTGRTRHYHFKVQRPNGRVLTTQIYFPGEALNARDSEFDPRLVMRMSTAEKRPFGRFDFIL
jgi:protocatechuate 3,4-dioxygenase beta subunit